MKISCIIFAVALFIVISTPVFAERVLLVDFGIANNDSVALNDVMVVDGKPTMFSEGAYSLKLLDSSGAAISSQSMSIVFFISGIGDVNTTIVESRFSGFENAGKLQLLHNDKVIFESPIALCDNNKVCNNYENYLSCPNDCPSGSADRYCDKVKDGKCDPDCAKDADEDCKSFLEKMNFVYIAGALIVLTIVFLLIKKKNPKNEFVNNTAASIAAPEQEKAQPMAEYGGPSEVNAILIDWAREQLAKGYTKEQISMGLIKVGYSAEIAEEILRRI